MGIASLLLVRSPQVDGRLSSEKTGGGYRSTRGSWVRIEASPIRFAGRTATPNFLIGGKTRNIEQFDTTGRSHTSDIRRPRSLPRRRPLRENFLRGKDLHYPGPVLPERRIRVR